MKKGIVHFINEEFGLNEAKLEELTTKKAVKVLLDYGFEKGKDFKVNGKAIYLTSEKVAQNIADELAGELEVTYDDEDNFKLSIFG